MKLSDVKKTLSDLERVHFKLPDGTQIPEHFHVTEVGLVTKHFIDCGGTERTDKVVNFQLWEADDYDHRLAAEKFLNILNLSEKVIGKNDDLEVEVEYQQATIGKFGLAFDGSNFILTNKQTDCLAKESCGIPDKAQKSACSPASDCC